LYTQEKAPKKMTDKFSRLKISLLNSKNLAAKEKLEIVSGAAPPPFRIFAGRLPRRLRRRNAFGLIQEYCTRKEIMLR